MIAMRHQSLPLLQVHTKYHGQGLHVLAIASMMVTRSLGGNIPPPTGYVESQNQYVFQLIPLML